MKSYLLDYVRYLSGLSEAAFAALLSGAFALLWARLKWMVLTCLLALSTAPFIRACREWANAVAGSPDEVIAVAYSYAVRQLKYPDTDKVLARALIRGCIQYFN